MSVVIAILLGLILVAIISSNKGSAQGVKRIIEFFIFGVGVSFVALLIWGCWVGSIVLLYDTYPTGNKWVGIITMVLFSIWPPVMFWFQRKSIAENYKKNRWKSIRSGVLLILGGFIFLIAIALENELRKNFEYGGWALLITPLTITFIVLLWRSLVREKSFHEIWFGPTDLEEPWRAVMREREIEESAYYSSWSENENSWDNLTTQEQEYFMQRKDADLSAIEERLTALSKRLEEEKATRGKISKWTVMGVFWLFLILTIFGLVGIIWDIVFSYAMELKFVKQFSQGQEIISGGIVIFSALGILGLVITALEDIPRRKTKKT